MVAFPLPQFNIDGVGASFIPRATRMHGAANDLLIVVAPAKRAQIEKALKDFGGSVLSTIDNGADAATAMVVRFMREGDPAVLWGRLGVSRERLAAPEFSVETGDHIGMMRRFRSCLVAANIKALETPRRIGVNLAGSTVYETIGGRVAVNDENAVHYEHDVLPDGTVKGAYRERFLRATNEAELADCAAGVVRSILTGETFSPKEIAQLHRDVTGGLDWPELGLFAFQEEVEAGLVIAASNSDVYGLRLRDLAREITDRVAPHAERPAQRQRLQQYSTPLTISAVASDILRIQQGESVLEPTAGNGALALGAAMAGAAIDGFEIDPARAARATRVLREVGALTAHIRAREFKRPLPDAPGKTFGVVLANPPFEAIPAQTVKDRAGTQLRISRLDHQIVFDSLEQLRDDGRAFLVLPAEMIEEGELDGARRFFNNYLNATFEVAGAVALDGKLYRKSGAEFPVLLYAIGPRRQTALTAAEAATLPNKLPVLRSTDELFAWADSTAEKMAALLEARSGAARAATSEAAAPTPDAPAQPPAPGPAPAKKVRRWWSGGVSARRVGAQAGARPGQAMPVAPSGPAQPAPPTPSSAVAGESPPPGPGPTAGEGAETATPPPPLPATEVAPGTAPGAAGTGEPDVPDAPQVPDVFEQPEEPDEESVFLASPDVLLDDIVIENDPFQITYEPASKVGGPNLKIQKALAEPVAAALADLERRRGPIDKFVAESLGVDEADLGGLLHAGQVDGVGLSLHAALRGESVIIGDLMGVGKGRQLAALARAAMKEDRPVIFFTDNPSLFTDFVARDLATVLRRPAAELPDVVRPFIMNSSPSASILDPEFEGERRKGAGVIFAASTETKKKIAAGISADVNLVLSSYSQLGAAGRQEKLAIIEKWIASLDQPPLLIMDESHRAAGETSNVGKLLTGLVEAVKARDGTTVYASGTALKGAKNLRVYGSALPALGMPTEVLISLIEKEPLALQEALSYEMARGGSLIARELDNTDVEREVVTLQDIEPIRYSQVLEKVDQFAYRMAELLRLGREIKDWAGEREKEMKSDIRDNVRDELEREKALGNVNVHIQSPASRFHHLSNYLTLSINGVFMEDMVMEALSRGHKPVVAVANTGDALVADLVASNLAETEVDGETPRISASGVVLPEKPHLGHVVKRMADRLLTVKECDGFGVMEERRLVEYEDWLADFNARVDSDDFAMLSLCVIDDLAVALEKHGLSLGEITGRSFMVRPDEKGFRVMGRGKPLKQDVVREFNNGRSDVLVINQSAAVGLSVHSSPANGFDIRRRQMIKAQMQGDVTQERQIDGRINRVGQVSSPLYTVPMQGLASSDRLAQLFNRKNRSLTAASTATRENESNIKESLDLLNEVGQVVCYQYLQNNPDIAETLDIKLDSDIEKLIEDGTAPRGFAEKLMGRMIALPTRTQQAIMSELDNAFSTRVAILDALGENPLRLREYDWRARVKLEKRLIAGVENARKMSERPLVLNRVEYFETVKPLRGEDIGLAVNRGIDLLTDHATTGRVMSIVERLEEIAPGAPGMPISFADEIFDRVMFRTDDLRSMGAVERAAEEADGIFARRAQLKEKAKDLKGFERQVVEAGEKALFLKDHAHLLQPGAILDLNPSVIGNVRETTLFHAASDLIDGTVYADQDVSVPAVLLAATFDESKPLNLGSWKLSFAVPGQETGFMVTMAGIYAAYEAAGDEPWCIRRAVPGRAGFGLMQEVAGIWSPAIADELSRVDQTLPSGAPFGDMEQVALYQDECLEAATMRAVFEGATGGKVKRSMMTLEGNLFSAVATLAGKRVGEKAMYTDENGAIRHCYLLKKDASKKLMEKLTTSVGNRVAFVPADEERIRSFLSSAAQMITCSPAATETYRASTIKAISADLMGRLADTAVPAEFEAMARKLAGKKGKPPELASWVENMVAGRFDAMRVDLVQSVRAMGVVNMGLFIGSDPFGDGQTCRTSLRLREEKDDAKVTFYLNNDVDGAVNLTRYMSDKGAFIVPSGARGEMLAVVKSGNRACAKGNVAADWTNAPFYRTRVRHSTVGKELTDQQYTANFLCSAARDDAADNVIGLKGAYVACHEILEMEARALADKLAAEADLRAAVESVMSVSSETDVEHRTRTDGRRASAAAPSMG
nr:strawberry notch family protein [Nitrosomonas nitrosa]